MTDVAGVTDEQLDETGLRAIEGSDHMRMAGQFGHDPDGWFRGTVRELVGEVRASHAREDELRAAVESAEGRHGMTTLTWASLEGLSLGEIYDRLDWATLARDVKDQLTEARHDARSALASQLAAAEKRLGLEPCRHPRNTGAQYIFSRSQTEDHCAVCSQRLMVITDEMLARATGGNE